jgi:membrane protease YdiL (CAAX protease family)
MPTESKNNSPRQASLIIGILTAPFLLNDFANIFVKDYRVWLAIDYIFVKAFPLAAVWFLLRTQKITYSDLGIKSVRFGPFIMLTLAMTFLGIVLDQLGSRLFTMLLPDTRLGGMPTITNPVLDQIDLYFGLSLVAVVEEVIFRGLYFTLLLRLLPGVTAVFVVSSLAFGLIHWSLGLSAIVHTAIIGGVFMVCMWRTGSVIPTIIAHFFVNYIAFSGILARFGY